MLRVISLLILFTISLLAKDKPNVIFILMDDMGYSDISCYGAKTVKTPHIDKLATEGLKFTDFHTGASICSPSRAAFLTGAYPQRCGLYMGINPNREEHWFLGLNPSEITLAEQFKKQNYKTLMVGKWHLGKQEKFSYFNQGFDEYYGAPCNMGHDPGFYDGKELIYKNTPLEKMTDLYTARILKHINEYKDQPFFLYYSHNYPHTPYKAGPKFKGSSKGGVRGDVIQELDWSIGEIVKSLKENDILENTMIIFTSDNGPTNNKFALPYSGTKYVTLEGGHRVPFILSWSKIKKRGTIKTPTIAMDLFPTLSEMIGEKLATDRVYDGVSLMPIMNGEELERKSNQPFFYYNSENLQAVRVGDWKLHLPRSKDELPFWDKNKQFLNLTKPVLFNIKSDLAESVDMADQKPELVQEMLELVAEMKLSLGEYKKRGKDQRPTGTLFPEVPIVSTSNDWKKISYTDKKAAVDEFPFKNRKSKKKKKK
ncbi:MAG: sulfatase [Lentisphaeraceae bacterium]|nr:sulfatase [Lentisphaeraceae bacterium]